MPLEEFPLLQNNTRLIRHKDTLYKVKVKYEDEETNNETAHQNITRRKAHSQLENTFRALLYIIQRDESLDLKPIQTQNFLISIIPTPWSFSKKYGFSQNGKELKAYPVQFEFRIKLQEDNEEVYGTTGISANTTKPKSGVETIEVVGNNVSEASGSAVQEGTTSGPSFTRSGRGSLLRDGKRLISKDDEKNQGKKGVVSKTGEDSKSQRVSRKDSDDNSVSDRGGLKRKLETSNIDQLSDHSRISKRSKSADEELKVERFHNRNNSNVSSSPRYSSHRLRVRKNKEHNEGTRHSERLKKKEKQTEISESESEQDQIKSKRPISKAPHKKLVTSDSETTDVDIKTNQFQKHRSRKGKKGRLEKDKTEETVSETGSKDKKTRIDREIPTDEYTGLAEAERDNKTTKHKPYTQNESPKCLAGKGESVNSPRVSTVLPQKRARPNPDLLSPRPGRQQALVRSPVDHVDLIASSRPVNTGNHRQALDEESQRIQRMRQQAPTQTYRNILLAQSRDRHMIEQAERAETDKLRQLYEPTAVRRSPRLHSQEKNTSLWQKIVGTVLTPFKNIMSGNKRRWSDIH